MLKAQWKVLLIYFLLLGFTFSLSLQAAEPVSKKVPPQRSVASAPASATSPDKPATAPTEAPASESKPESAPVLSSKLIEESKSVKAIKKKGATVAEGNSEMGPANLFEDENAFLAGLDYPELQVVPRASERLALEAQAEKESLVRHYWPVQLSATALLIAGATATGKYRETDPTDAQKKENQFASQMSVLVGAMWLGGTLYLESSLSYSKANNELKKTTGKDRKSQLLKERLAEEALERPAKIARIVNNVSVWTTLGLGIYLSSHTKPSYPNYAGFAIGLAFIPWLIENRLVENWEKHQEYKRKIYAPITNFDLKIDPQSGEATPLLGLQWRF